jgi:D-aspartate ligase
MMNGVAYNQRISEKRAHVVLLGLVDTGYGMVRSLALKGIPVIAFESSRNHPEIRSSLCQMRFFQDHNDLLNQLIVMPEELGHKPVLFISSDSLVKFYSDNSRELSKKYLTHFPDADTVNLLLEKTRFSEFAIKNGFTIPKTHIVRSWADIRSMETNTFPCVVKPYWRRQKWTEAKFPKVFFFKEKKEFDLKIHRIFSVEQNLIIQEWIPGNDGNIYFCLTYFDGQSKCISSFTGRKLRQWRVATGATSCAEPIDEPLVKKETLRLFDAVLFKGFGSVEFKRHPDTGIFYIMEPTVGRPNHQSYLATANGVNMPCEAYSSLTGMRFAFERQIKQHVVWIDDMDDIFSIAVNLIKGQLNYRDLVKTIFSKKSFRYLNVKDPGPFMALWSIVAYKLVRKMFRLIMYDRRRRKCNLNR